MFKVLAVLALLIASCMSVQIRPYASSGKCMYYNPGNTWVQPSFSSCQGSTALAYQWTETKISGFFTYTDGVFGLCLGESQGNLVGVDCSGNQNALFVKEATSEGYFRLKHILTNKCINNHATTSKFYFEQCGLNGSYQWFILV